MNPDILDLAEEAVGQQLGVPVMNWSMHGIKEHEALFKTLTFPAFTRFVICEGSKKNLRYWKFHSAYTVCSIGISGQRLPSNQTLIQITSTYFRNAGIICMLIEN